MDKALESKAVLAIYDVRGIQNYIFRTNHIKEIIGASKIVENIIMEGLESVVQTEAEEYKGMYLLDWTKEENTPDAFETNNTVQMQVLFIGGGNAYVLYRTGELCKKVNRAFAKYILEHTYSLNLAVAVVEKTSNYINDYENIHKKLREIKARMPEVKPVGAMPFMSTDTLTGFPLSKKEEKPETAYYCTESYLKRKKYEQLYKIQQSKGIKVKEAYEEDAEKILDNMVTEKGDNSTLAVIHIDGNNMGNRIKEIMRKTTEYAKAVQAMRVVSKNISEGFQAAYDAMTAYIDETLSDRVKKNRVGKLYRKIILAGDDITFICNAKLAIKAVSVFMHTLAIRKLYEDADKDETLNLAKYGFSACAGIAYFNSHFPFSDAYQVAEACCASAKARAKDRRYLEDDGGIANFLDYQICTHIKAADLGNYRKKQYEVNEAGSSILMRPYFINTYQEKPVQVQNANSLQCDIDMLERAVEHFIMKMPRGQAKTLRNSFGMGKEEVDKYITFLESRSVGLPVCDREYWYDALEIMDLYIGEGQCDEDKN